jgi:hypothetical protein
MTDVLYFLSSSAVLVGACAMVVPMSYELGESVCTSEDGQTGAGLLFSAAAISANLTGVMYCLCYLK